jgi:Alpha/beta hydrolase domain
LLPSVRISNGKEVTFFLFLGIGGRLRTDLDVKVFKVDTETDILFLGEVAARQPDSDILRTWEVAGTSHVGFSGFADRVALTVRDGLPVPNPSPCNRQALSHVPTFQVLNAVYDHLVRWVADGTPPPTAPRIELASTGPPVVVARDRFGNALGGIQLSQHAVPTAVNDGLNSGPGFCILYGSHTPFDEVTLARLLPEPRSVCLGREPREQRQRGGRLHPARGCGGEQASGSAVRDRQIETLTTSRLYATRQLLEQVESLDRQVSGFEHRIHVSHL